MSKHAVSYWSESKNRSFMIEELNDFHLVSARNKLAEWLEEHKGKDAPKVEDAQPDGSMRVLAALDAELNHRKLDPRYKGGMAPDDERLTAGGHVQDLRAKPEPR